MKEYMIDSILGIVLMIVFSGVGTSQQIVAIYMYVNNHS